MKQSMGISCFVGWMRRVCATFSVFPATTTWSSCGNLKTVVRWRGSAGPPDKRADPIQQAAGCCSTWRGDRRRNHHSDHFDFGVRCGERFTDLVGQCQKCGFLICGACALREEGAQTHFNLVRCYPFRFVGHAPRRFTVRTERNSISHA
jgi:hypothetical protein